MKGPLYRSDDGQKEGTREEVEAYEASLNPLAKFKFPWAITPSGWRNKEHEPVNEMIAGIALLNLMPLVEDLRQAVARGVGVNWRDRSMYGGWGEEARALLLAYEKALEVKS